MTSKKKEKTVNELNKSRRKLALNEFLSDPKQKELGSVFLAGFRMYVGETPYKTQAEWERTLEAYRNRKKGRKE